MHRATWIATGVLAVTLAGLGAQEATVASKPAAKAATAPKATQTAAPAVARPVAKPVAKAVAKPATSTASTTPAPKAATTAVIPTPAAIPFNRGIIVLDAAHGGTDNGSRLSDSLVEKDVTLGLAFKLRSLLTARGFTVVMTRDSDDNKTNNGAPVQVLSLDDRAGLANHAHALACLLLHATAAGQGVHLYSSELAPTGTQPAMNPWLTAQAPWVTESQNLEKTFGVALHRSGIATVMSRASVRPLDSLTCPALVVELAPDGDDADSTNDGAYQQKVATALTGALLNWKTNAQPPLPASGNGEVRQ